MEGKYHGKGVLYHDNGKIKYEGVFEDDNFQGKGKLYDINGNVLYEGDFSNGYYYKGEKKDGKKNGKGIEYYDNGKVAYEGDFVDDKRVGNGKSYYFTTRIWNEFKGYYHFRYYAGAGK